MDEIAKVYQELKRNIADTEARLKHDIRQKDSHGKEHDDHAKNVKTGCGCVCGPCWERWADTAAAWQRAPRAKKPVWPFSSRRPPWPAGGGGSSTRQQSSQQPRGSPWSRGHHQQSSAPSPPAAGPAESGWSGSDASGMPFAGQPRCGRHGVNGERPFRPTPR